MFCYEILNSDTLAALWPSGDAWREADSPSSLYDCFVSSFKLLIVRNWPVPFIGLASRWFSLLFYIVLE